MNRRQAAKSCHAFIAHTEGTVPCQQLCRRAHNCGATSAVAGRTRPAKLPELLLISSAKGWLGSNRGHKAGMRAMCVKTQAQQHDTLAAMPSRKHEGRSSMLAASSVRMPCVKAQTRATNSKDGCNSGTRMATQHARDAAGPAASSWRPCLFTVLQHTATTHHAAADLSLGRITCAYIATDRQISSCHSAQTSAKERTHSRKQVRADTA